MSGPVTIIKFKNVSDTRYINTETAFLLMRVKSPFGSMNQNYILTGILFMRKGCNEGGGGNPGMMFWMRPR
jgi:hypothetical protein